MKPLEEMTDLELAAEWQHAATAPYKHELAEQMSHRLSTHPAQRIADLSGCVVTKDINGMWRQWIMWTDGNAPNLSDDGFWCSNAADSIVIKLPDDNKPWQESIYRPRVKGTDDGKTSR